MAILGSLESMLLSFGYVLLFGFVFAESGLFFGFFLPGDSLLFTAGVLAQRGLLDIWIVIPGVIICAILGDQVGYWSGAKFGRRFFTKPGDFFREPDHVKSAEGFFKKHGKKAIVLARFVPAVRTFAPIVAGIAQMEYRTFVSYNILGGILWGAGMTLAGYFIGKAFPDADAIITLIIVLAMTVPAIPVFLHLFAVHRKSKNKQKRWPQK